jgi:hypothetical protein
VRRLEANSDDWIVGPRETQPTHLVAQIEMDCWFVGELRRNEGAGRRPTELEQMIVVTA